MSYDPRIIRTYSGYDVYLDSPLGRVFQATFDTLAEAREWANEHRDDLWRTSPVPPE